MATQKATLTFRRYRNADPMTPSIYFFVEETIEVVGAKAGFSVLPSDNPVVCNVWYDNRDGTGVHSTEGVLLANLVRYRVDTIPDPPKQ